MVQRLTACFSAPGRGLGAALVLAAGLLAFGVVQGQTPSGTATTTATATPSPASNEAPLASADPVLEARVMKLSAELRCLVCQNETIAASHADLAVDLRNQVREMLRAGQSEDQVLEFMTARYGDFVLYRPPLKGITALLWFGPALALVLGVFILWFILYRRSRLAPEAFEPDLEADPLDPRAAQGAPHSSQKI